VNQEGYMPNYPKVADGRILRRQPGRDDHPLVFRLQAGGCEHRCRCVPRHADTASGLGLHVQPHALPESLRGGLQRLQHAGAVSASGAGLGRVDAL
jgi:hypothetical protein